MKICFSRGAWSTDDVSYAYSYRFPGTPEYLQQDDCVENRQLSEQDYDWENISVFAKDKYVPGAKITTRCSLRGLAAPLITIAKDIYDEGGEKKFGDYLEIVLYREGVNVWEMVMDENKTVTWKKLLGVKFPVTEDEAHTLTVETTADGMHITADDKKIYLYRPMYESFYLGIDACEGLCRFYSMEIAQ